MWPDGFMDVIAQNHILQAVYYSDVDDLDSHLEPVSVPIEPRDHSDEAAQQQAGCRKHLTHTHTSRVHSQFAPTAARFTEMLLQLQKTLIWSHESARGWWTRFCNCYLSLARLFYCFGYFSFQSSFLGFKVACRYNRQLVCEWVYGVCVCVCVCSAVIRANTHAKTLCLCAAVLAFWPTVEEGWHSSKQEMKPYSSPCVRVCVCVCVCACLLRFLLILACVFWSLSCLSWWSPPRCLAVKCRVCLYFFLSLLDI